MHTPAPPPRTLTRRGATLAALALLARPRRAGAGHIVGDHLEVTFALATGVVAMSPRTRATRPIAHPAAPGATSGVQVTVEPTALIAVHAATRARRWRVPASQPQGGVVVVGDRVYSVEPGPRGVHGVDYALVERALATGRVLRRIAFSLPGSAGDTLDAALTPAAPGQLVWSVNVLSYG